MTRYKELQIIKHALQHYIQREGATQKDLEAEKRLLTKIEGAVDDLKEKYGLCTGRTFLGGGLYRE